MACHAVAIGPNSGNIITISASDVGTDWGPGAETGPVNSLSFLVINLFVVRFVHKKKCHHHAFKSERLSQLGRSCRCLFIPRLII